jgi:DNA-binding response OmpR family regulator
VRTVHILLATDADWVVDEVTAALGDAETSFTVCREGRAVTEAIRRQVPDVAILDLQVGSMGGMAITMGLRLDQSAGTLPDVPVLMLLDRAVDVFLAQRSGADGWLIKPLDALRLKRAAIAVADGGRYTEGVPEPFVDDVADVADDAGPEDGEPADEATSEADSAEEEAATAG